MEQLSEYMPYFTSIVCALISGIVTYMVSRKQTKNEINKTALIIYLSSFSSLYPVQKSRQNSIK